MRGHPFYAAKAGMKTLQKSFLIFLSGLLLFSIFPSFAEDLETAQDESQKILVYELEDAIHGGTVQILKTIFQKAHDENFQAVLIELDTPGGLFDATEDIVKLFLNTDIPVIVYVAPSGAKAGSAGTFITMAAHVAVMAPGTYIGAAHPVALFGGGKEEDEQSKIMRKKIESAATSFIETIALERKRNEDWAKKAVLESETLTQDKALEYNVIDFVAATRAELLQKIDGRQIKLLTTQKILRTKESLLVVYEPELKHRFLSAIASPTVMYLLLLGIMAGIYLEISHPGALIPGIGAAVCLVLFLFASQILPIESFGILLVAIAMGLLIAEIFVTSYGLLTIAGIGCFVAGSLFLFDPEKTDVFVPLSYISGASLALLGIAVTIAFALVRTFRRPQRVGQESLVGQQGVVIDAIAPQKPGRVFVVGEYWNATAGEDIPAGSRVEVVGTKGLLAEVKKK